MIVNRKLVLIFQDRRSGLNRKKPWRYKYKSRKLVLLLVLIEMRNNSGGKKYVSIVYEGEDDRENVRMES